MYYAVMVLLAAFGLWTLLSRGSPLKDIALGTLLATLVSVWIVQSLFYVEIRHRWGVEPLMLVLASAGAWHAATWRRGYASPQSWRPRDVTTT